MIIHGYHLFQTSLFVCFISEARSFVRRGGPVVGLMGFVASKIGIYKDKLLIWEMTHVRWGTSKNNLIF